MSPSFRLPVAILILGVLASAPAGAGVFQFGWAGVNLEVPDAPGGGGTPVTVSDTRSIGHDFTQVDDIAVTLNFAGSDGAGGSGTMWNGDLHVTLSHEGGASVVLLNRVGRDTGSLSGAAGNGISVTLDSSSLFDVHLAAGSGSLVGTFQPDGRSVSPTLVVAASPRDALLDGFAATLGAGFGAADLWTLSVTDLDTGNLARLESWSVTVTGVPEPTTWAGVTSLGLALWAALRRRSQGATR